MSELQDIAQAVAYELELNFNSSGAEQPLTISRTYVPIYLIEDNPGLQLYVVGTGPIEIDLSGGTRAQTPKSFTVMVGIYDGISRSEGVHDQDEMDDMCDFVQQVIDLMISKYRLTHYQNATLQKITNAVAFDAGSLDQRDIFATVIELTYWLMS